MKKIYLCCKEEKNGKFQSLKKRKYFVHVFNISFVGKKINCNLKKTYFNGGGAIFFKRTVKFFFYRGKNDLF